MGMLPAPAGPSPRRLLALILPAIVILAVLSVGILFLTPYRSPSGTLPIPAGSVIQPGPSEGRYEASFNFSWGPGGYLEGSWVATADVSAFVIPRLSCVYCPLMRIYMLHGTAGTFNVSFGGDGGSYTNMTLRFLAPSALAGIGIVRTVQVVYPPMTPILRAGSNLSGTGLEYWSFAVRSPGAFLVGAWTAVNTSLDEYVGIPQPAGCGTWPPATPPSRYEGSFSSFLTPGAYSVGVDLCLMGPWNVTVTQTVGIFYP